MLFCVVVENNILCCCLSVLLCVHVVDIILWCGCWQYFVMLLITLCVAVDNSTLCCCCRRLLQMGVYNAELFNNLGLCCFYAQQYDMTLTCFERALSLADDQTLPDVWFNIGHVALVSAFNSSPLYGRLEEGGWKGACIHGPLPG